MSAQQKIEKLIKKIKADLLLDPSICNKCKVVLPLNRTESADQDYCIGYLQSKLENPELMPTPDNLKWINAIAQYHLNYDSSTKNRKANKKNKS